MRILHTSDWHLGRQIEGQLRLEEQEAFLDDLYSICERELVDCLIISGDLYDTTNPPAKAETLFYRYAKKLSNNGKRPIILIAGNHDSPERISAAIPLANELGILLVGKPRAYFDLTTLGDVKVSRSGLGFIELDFDDKGVLGLGLLPFPSESRLGELFQNLNEDEGKQALSYSSKVGQLMDEITEQFNPQAFNVVTSHFYTYGGVVSDSERPLQIGGAYTVYDAHLPGADYVALGHLHRHQAVKENVIYSGSPLQYSRSEAGQEKSVVLIDSLTTGKNHIKRIPIIQTKPIEVWRVKGIDAAVEKCEAEKDRSVWAYLEIESETYPERSMLKLLYTIKPDLLAIIPVGTSQNQVVSTETDEVFDLDMSALFSLFYESTNGAPPSEGVLKVFGEIIHAEEGSDETNPA